MKKLIFLIIFAVMILSLQGCGNSSGNGGGNGLKNEKVEDYSVKIVYEGTEIKSYSINDIKKMPTTNFELDGYTPFRTWRNRTGGHRSFGWNRA